MSDHISTEEAERIAKRLERMSPWLGIEVARKQLYEASDALRSLAAERDELKSYNASLAEIVTALQDRRALTGLAVDASKEQVAEILRYVAASGRETYDAALGEERG